MSRKPTLACTALILLAARTAKAEGELFLYNWLNYFPPELLERFEAETGIAVKLNVYDSNETMLASLRTGAVGHDVVVPSDRMVAIMIDEGLVERIDAASMANFAYVTAPHHAPPGDPERAYSAPYLWGTTGFAYDSAKVNGELEESWGEVFEPRPELAGKIAMLDDEVEVWDAAAYYAGASRCTEDPAEARLILDVLEAQEPKVATYRSDGTIDRMATGEVVLHMQWNGASHRTRQTLPTVTYVYPKEGLTYWADSFVVPKGAPNLENAKTFINWMMAPRNAATASNYTGYMSAISGAEEFMDRALKENPAINMPARYADRLRPNESCSAESRELRGNVWARLRG